MKKSLLFLFIIASIFSACKKNDDYVFSQSPDERINAAIASYQSKLTTADNGWKALLTVDGGNGGKFSFYFKFNDQNRVKMLSDFDTASAVILQESSYRLKAEQQPTLIFDSYSYVHVLADPNEATVTVQANINNGPVGKGLLSDFEFIFDNEKVKADTIELSGKVNHSKLVLVKATKAEGDAYNAGQLGAGLNITKILTYFKRLTIGNQLLDVYVNTAARTITFSWLDTSGNLKTFTTTYYLTIGGIIFTNPLVIGSLSVKSFDNIGWNATTQTASFTTNGAAATITGIAAPLKLDVGAARRWWQYAIDNGGKYWVTINAFHVNGVDDAYKLATIPGYEGFTIFWPRFGVSGGLNYDLLSPITNGAIEFGAAFRPPTFTADGRIIFPFLGTLGVVPANGSAPYINTRNQMAESSGYYLVQTSANTYDMVSAKDGKAWITWEWVF